MSALVTFVMNFAFRSSSRNHSFSKPYWVVNSAQCLSAAVAPPGCRELGSHQLLYRASRC
jgi:hypothetical protein